MLQALIAYVLVALAGAWVLWNLVLPASLRLRLRPARARRGDGLAGGCADGGCANCASGCSSPDQPVTVRVHTGKRV